MKLVIKTRNSVNGTQISIGKFPPGKRDYLFKNSVCSGKFPVGRTKKRVPFTSQPEFPEFFGKWKTPIVNGRIAVNIPEYIVGPTRVTRSHHSSKFINIGSNQSNTFKYNFFTRTRMEHFTILLINYISLLWTLLNLLLRTILVFLIDIIYHYHQLFI